jgi:hypothetical protein
MTTTSSPTSRPAEQVSPDDLLGGFSHSHLFRWFLAAFIVHAVLIGAFSVGTIREWVDPEGAKARKEAALAAAKAASESSEGKPADAEAKPGETQAAEGKPAEAKSPIERATTEAATREEIPNAPDDLGLSIEDTNPQ